MDKFGDFDESYLALIGDVRGSRQHPDRAVLQAELREELARLSDDLDLDVPLAITAGDEFQGVFAASGAALAVDVLVSVTETLHPTELAFGLGWGPLSTPVGGNVSELDGACFHLAREALEQAKDEGSWGRLAGVDDGADALVSGTLGLMGAIRAGWTEKQATYVRDARRYDRYKEVAESHDVVPSVVTESLKAAQFRAMLRAEDGLRAAFARFGSKTERPSSSAE